MHVLSATGHRTVNDLDGGNMFWYDGSQTIAEPRIEAWNLAHAKEEDPEEDETEPPEDEEKK